ncbi:MAG: metal ABC transporter solute-binding protein, Zn/Mn family [Lachnospira pectinoschiza]
MWLSLKNAAVLTQYLADIVKDLDKDNSQLYQDNADAYINKLAGLDSDYENVCENSKLKTVIWRQISIRVSC